MTTNTVTAAVAKRDTGPVKVMWGRRNHFAAVLPQSVDVEAFLGTAAGALYASDDLMKAATASPDSLIVALMRAAALGHMPGTDEFYLTPRKKKGIPQVLGIEGYRGVIERMYRSGAVSRVVVREVCALDQFRYIEGADDKPVHDFGGQGLTGADFFGEHGTRDRGEMVGVYAYAELLTGAVSRVVILNRDDVYAAREAGGWRSDDPYSPWNRYDAGKDNPEFQGRSMWWKTAAKRLEPWVPTSAEYRREQLRAAAAASYVGSPAPDSNGMPPSLGVQPVYDAEVVEDPPSSAAAADEHFAAADVPGPATPQPPAVEQDPPPAPGPGTHTILKTQLSQLRKLPLGQEPDLVEAASLLIGRPLPMLEALNRDEATQILDAWEDALKYAGGDTEAAAASIENLVRDRLAADTANLAAEGPDDDV